MCFYSSKDSLNELVRQVTEQTRAEMSAAFGPETAALLDTGLFFRGLGIARNMPSFKKKKLDLPPKRKRRSQGTGSESSQSAQSYTGKSDSSRSTPSITVRSESEKQGICSDEQSVDDEDQQSTTGR
ncbi:unnamed protein product [Gongylonema pulchrum]|uniref:MLF1 n=1 Tax=Gongylonema pulchrum TaxID=637853 RepID=A0A183DDA9_9BILA|nr:unnamed protein product [Gongylonema pulchrum]